MSPEDIIISIIIGLGTGIGTGLGTGFYTGNKVSKKFAIKAEKQKEYEELQKLLWATNTLDIKLDDYARKRTDPIQEKVCETALRLRESTTIFTTQEQRVKKYTKKEKDNLQAYHNFLIRLVDDFSDSPVSLTKEDILTKQTELLRYKYSILEQSERILKS